MAETDAVFINLIGEHVSAPNAPRMPRSKNRVVCEGNCQWLEEFWSPKEIAKQLVLDFRDEPSMRIRREGMYQALFVSFAPVVDTSCRPAPIGESSNSTMD